MTANKTFKKAALSRSQVGLIHNVTGLSEKQIRTLLKNGSRPANHLIATAWDEIIAELGLAKKAAAK